MPSLHIPKPHLITPPLTPASSINSASTDSVPRIPDSASNFLLISQLSRTAVTDQLLQPAINEALASIQPNSTDEIIRATNTLCIDSHGEAILAFYDIRHAMAARDILSRPAKGFLTACVNPASQSDSLQCRFLTKSETVQLIGQSPIVASIDGQVFVTRTPENNSSDSDDQDHSPPSPSRVANALRGLFQTYGDLRSFDLIHEQNESQLFRLEFLDYRHASAAQAQLNDQKFLGTKLVISRTQPDQDATVILRTPSRLSTCRDRFPVSSPNDTQFNPNSVYYTSPDVPHVHTPSPSHPAPPTPAESAPAEPSVQNTITSPVYPSPFYHPYSPEYFYPHMSHHYYTQPPTNSPTPASPVFYHHPAMVAHSSPPLPAPNYEYDAPPHPGLSMYPIPYMYDPHAMAGAPPVQYPMGYMPMPVDAAEYWQNTRSPTTTTEADCYYPRRPVYYPVTIPPPPPPLPPTTGEDGSIDDTTTTTAPTTTHRPRMIRNPLSSSKSRESANPTPERNQLNIPRIEDGQDTRTTVMIKNIPNKMTDRDLTSYIAKVCPRRIDFLYLRMDFKNGCNVGYAFVNFITVQDLMAFAKKRLGEKWNMFSSEKVLQMSYANYQGKEALIEKFKNSCIMDEREGWRPKIFFSDGPQQGLPQEFPPPTHLRRKERSSFNRGALYVPGFTHDAGAGAGAGGGQYRPMPQQQQQQFQPQPHGAKRILNNNDSRYRARQQGMDSHQHQHQNQNHNNNPAAGAGAGSEDRRFPIAEDVSE